MWILRHFHPERWIVLPNDQIPHRGNVSGLRSSASSTLFSEHFIQRIYIFGIFQPLMGEKMTLAEQMCMKNVCKHQCLTLKGPYKEETKNKWSQITYATVFVCHINSTAKDEEQR